jgi:protoporphyrinogen/coproporphyrinogen III oxidase
MKPVVVVGAGPAGLAAAYTLLENGVSPIVLEARGRFGGRVATERREGFVVDLGAQFFSERYTSTLQMCRGLGIGARLKPFPLAAGIWRNGMVRRGPTLLTWRAVPPFLRLLFWTALYGSRFQASRIAEQVALGSISTRRLALDRYGSAVLDEWLQPFISGATAALPEDVAAACAISYLWYNLAPCLTFVGGLAEFVEALAEKIPNKRPGAEVTEVVVEGRAVRSVRYLQGGSTHDIETDAVVIATPATQAAALFPRPEFDPSFLAGVKYTRSIHVACALDKKQLERLYAIAVPRGGALRIALITEDANKSAGYVPPGGGLVHAVTYDDRCADLWDQPDAIVAEEIAKEVRGLIPQFPTHTAFTIVHRWSPNMCITPPGHFVAAERFRAQAEIVRGLHFAGEYLSVPCVEGAVVSGVRAANRLLGS